ncbi:Hypothetical_protein [Hexamita inflata]|uniref:Hypothetical_protein n=1 Tax=Hexamita inflata TaxID=28002 RepID=A0ABP1IT34_9EUKA
MSRRMNYFTYLRDIVLTIRRYAVFVQLSHATYVVKTLSQFLTNDRSLKRQTMPKPSLKTRKRQKKVRKLNLRRISKKRLLTKRSQRTLRSKKRKSQRIRVDSQIF